MKKISLKKTAVSLSLATLLLASVPLSADRITAGDAHNLVARGDSTQYVWGSDANGQLGDGLTLDALNPIPVVDIRYRAQAGAVAVVSYGNNNLVLLDDATLKGWGPNENFQLGSGLLYSGKYRGDVPDGSTEPVQPIETDKSLTYPTEVVDPEGERIKNISSIALGSNFAAAVNQSGQVLVWGNLDAFQDREESREPVNRFRDKFFDPSIEFIDSDYRDGDPATDFTLQYMRDELGNRYSGIIAVAVGDGHLLALSSTGQVLAWGENSAGQLADGTQRQRAYPVYVQSAEGVYVSGIRSITVRGNTNVAVKYDGALLGWGDSIASTSTTISTESSDTDEVDDSDTSSGADKSYAEPLFDGDGNQITKIYRVALGESHALAITLNRQVIGFGSNSNGQLGDGTNSSVTGAATVVLSNGQPLGNITEIAVGSSHSMALRADGFVYTWGSGESGELGDGSNIDSYYAVNARNENNVPFSLFGY